MAHIGGGADFDGPAGRRRRLDEFAIYATVFLMIAAATVDIGLLLFTRSQIDAAVSAGAQYAANNAALVASNPSVSTPISRICRQHQRHRLGDQHGRRQQQQ